jgi:hypothetical protein
MIAVTVVTASAGEIDWLVTPGGTYTWAGGLAPLVGNNIQVATATGVGTASNSATTLAVNGSLSFTSGAFNGVPDATWSWGAGGTLNLTGCIAGVTTSGSCNASTNTVLVSDDFQSVTVAPIGSSSFDLVFGQLQGTLNSALATYFGVPTQFAGDSLSVILSASGAGTKFTGFNLGGIITTRPVVAVPEDWNLLVGLVFFAGALGILGLAVRLGLLRTVIT